MKEPWGEIAYETNWSPQAAVFRHSQAEYNWTADGTVTSSACWLVGPQQGRRLWMW
jgi:hypothetical protein